MVPPRPIVFGNWKMHGLRADACTLATAVAGRPGSRTGTLGIFPPFTVLNEVAGAVAGMDVVVGGQDCHAEAKGAFTGSISAPMLKDAGATAVLAGHSERRHGLGETDAMVQGKAAAGLAAGLLVVLCIGETETQRMAGQTIAVLDAQLEGSWPAGATADRLVVAYEPVWAIGTGRTATTLDIADSHAAIGRKLAALGAPDVAILYGGSVKADNAAEIMAVPGVAGVLVGGASLDAAGFWTIYQAGGGA
jgi:triosephosphate isomerase